MKSTLVSAALTAALSQGGTIPTEIVYLPEGENPINATVDGAPKPILVRVPRERGHEIAARFQADLTKRQGENVRPWFSFQHQAGPASGLPQAFRYEPGKGVMASVEWTASGRTGIEGRDWSYFSPTFLMDEEGMPSGLPAKGEFGALVNEPAFRGIQRIAASDTGGEIHEGTAVEMIHAKARQLVASGQAGDLDEGIVKAVERNPDLYRAAMCADPVRKETLTALAKIKEQSVSTSRDQLEALADEIHLKGDAESETDAFVEACIRRPDLYQAWQDEIGDRLEGFMEQTQKQRSETKTIFASDFHTKAAALVTAGNAKDIDEAFGIVAASDPASYSDYLRRLQ